MGTSREQLPVDGGENCNCRAQNHPSDEQDVDGELNQPTLLDHTLTIGPERQPGGERLALELPIESPYFLPGLALDFLPRASATSGPGVQSSPRFWYAC